MSISLDPTARATEQLDKKLQAVLEATESQHPFSKQNFVSMRKLVFLWIIGERNQEIGPLLREEIQKIVADEREIWILGTNPQDISGERIYEQIRTGIASAAHNYLNVDMDNLLICPVLLPGCMESPGAAQKFAEASLYVQQELKKRHRFPEWSPYVLLHDEKVEETRLQMDGAVQFMTALMEDGRRDFRECCHPGCIITDVNERNQEIAWEQRAKIIVMLTVFQNTNCQDEQKVNLVFAPISESEKDRYFFTARAISICEPVKSLTLNRLLAVHNFFRHGRFSQEKLFDRWNNLFYQSREWQEHLDQIAHNEKYEILTAPLYSNIPQNDQNAFMEALKSFCKTYYFEPLEEREEALLSEWWKSLYEEYFLKVVGSVDNLDGLEANREKILSKVPLLAVKRAALANDLRLQCENWLGSELQKYPRKVAEKALNVDGMHMQRFRTQKEALKDSLDRLETVIRNQILRLRQSELLLNTGGGHIADPEQEALSWLNEYTNNDPRMVTQIYELYQKALCEVFQSGRLNKDENSMQLLEIYSRIVSGSIESRESYMKTKLANLAVSDMGQLIGKLGQSWLFPVRGLVGAVNDNAQRLYVMGNKNNLLCQQILNQQNFKVAFKEGMLDDRLEIVRVSETFSVRKLLSEGQEGEASGSL